MNRTAPFRFTPAPFPPDPLVGHRRNPRRARPFRALGLVLLLGFSVAGCASKKQPDLNANRPVPTMSQLLETESGGFVFSRGSGGAFESCRYVVILKPTQPLAKTLYLHTRFEDPANAARPIEVDSEAAPGLEHIQVESRPVRGLRTGRNYKVEIVIFDSPERNHAIGVHTQMVQAMVKF